MKFKLLLFNSSIILLGFSCDPNRNSGGIFLTTVIGTLNTSSESINLGDTIKLEVKLPPSVNATNQNGENRVETVNSLQRAFFGYHIFRIDTIMHRVYSYSGESMKVNYFLNPGYEINPCQPCFSGFAYLQKDNPPFIAVLHLIPQVKGIFYLEIDSQPGQFKINNSFEGLFSVRLNIPNKHLELVDQHIPGFANAVIQAGTSLYCFKVL